MIHLRITKYRTIVLFCFMMLCGLTSHARTQNEDSHLVDRIQAAYNQFRYQEVVELAMEALKTVPPPTPRARVDIHTYLAYSYIALGMTDEARQQFRDALTIDPELTLDPVYVSPKIIAIFNEVKRENEQMQENKGLSPEQAKLISDLNTLSLQREAAWRSLVIPGWGQLHKGQNRKATIFLAAHAINIGSLVYTHVRTKSIHDEYLNAREPSDIESKYDRYNRFYKTRTFFILSTATVWLASYIDAAFSLPPSGGSNRQNDQTDHIRPMIGPDFFGVIYTLQF